jgi:putative flippase GtrA
MNARTRPSPAGGRPDGLLRSPRPRPLRFTLTGATAGIVQLLLLRCLEAAGAPPLVSNGLGFLVAAQVNFVLSQAFTWADRPPDVATTETLPRRWVRFHAAISGTALLNMLVFAAARVTMPDLPASALGIGVAAAVNFYLANRVVFRRAQRRGHPFGPISVRGGLGTLGRLSTRLGDLLQRRSHLPSALPGDAPPRRRRPGRHRDGGALALHRQHGRVTNRRQDGADRSGACESRHVRHSDPWPNHPTSVRWPIGARWTPIATR